MIPIERFAQLQAALELVPDPASILAGAGIDDDEWRRTVSHYIGELDAQMRVGPSELGARYLASYFAAIESYRRPVVTTRAPVAQTTEVDVNRVREGRDGGIPFRSGGSR